MTSVPRTSHVSLRERGPQRKQRKPSDRLCRQPDGAMFDDVKKIALKLYKGIGTPLSLELYHALQAGDVMKIASTSVRAENYDSVEAYYLDACAGNFLRKYADLAKLGRNIPKNLTKRAAVDEFFRAEAQCAETNQFFSEVSRGNISLTPFLRRVLHRAQELAKDYFGKVPRQRDLSPRFGPGATSQCGGDGVTVAHKLTAYPECYRDAVPLVAGLYDSSPVWYNLLARVHPMCSYNVFGFPDDHGNLVVRSARIAPKLIRGNRFTTVPKDALTDRGICIEAHSVGIFQLAVGGILAERIAAIGLRKELQQEINKKAARQASQDGYRATVDLKAASDTIALHFLRYLLSWSLDWFELLSSLRAPETEVDGEWVELEKFSSMGNGFTFELETLVFYILAKAVCDELAITAPIDVYGDDMIVPAECLAALTEVLSACGFTTNVKKTFCGTGFNESCGGDFYRGEDVRPYFLKEVVLTVNYAD